MTKKKQPFTRAELMALAIAKLEALPNGPDPVLQAMLDEKAAKGEKATWADFWALIPNQNQELDTDYRVFYEKTKASYEALLLSDVMFSLAGIAPSNTDEELAQWTDIRFWGLMEFPDFQLSAKKVAEAVEAAAAIRGGAAIGATRK